MTERTENEFQKIDRIVEQEDREQLFLLRDNAVFAIALHQILVNRYDNDPDSLDEVQMDLFLGMHLENAGQADSILAFLQEGFPEYKDRVVESLVRIEAPKSAEIIQQAIDLLPEDGSWFYDTCDKGSEELMDKLDRDFSDYPDGSMNDLYRKYADKYRQMI